MAKSVLIVDDNATIRQILCRVFTSEEFSVCSQAENGREAVEKAQKMHPDLIVMDLSMPEMNGIQATSTLRRSMVQIPIILFSEYADALSDREVRSAGFSASVSKSDNVAVLLNKARDLTYHNAA